MSNQLAWDMDGSCGFPEFLYNEKEIVLSF